MSLITVNVTLPQGNRISLHGLHPSTAKEEIMTRVKGLCPSLSLRARLHVLPPQVDFDRWMSDDYGFKGNSVVIPLVRTESLKKTMVYANPWEDEEEDNEEEEEEEEEDDEEDEEEDEEEEEEEDDEEEDDEEEEEDEEDEEEDEEDD